MKLSLAAGLGTCLIATLTEAAGVGVHLTVLERLRNYIPPELSDYYDYSLAGAFFPDAFYSCMDLSDAAEETHWPPFMKTAVEYLQETYGLAEHGTSSESDGGENTDFDSDERYKHQLSVSTASSAHPKSSIFSSVRDFASRINSFGSKNTGGNDARMALKAFLYGVLTHEVADVSWHSLGIKQGLLRYMADREFDGNVDDAHFNLDTGGDMIFVRRLLLSGDDSSYLRQTWNYPKSDIIEIFKRMGYRLNGAQLDYCMLRGKAAARAELQVAPTLFYSYAQKSPILFNNLEDYYLGGMTEMTTSARHCMYNLDKWMTEGPPRDSWTLCEIFYGVAEKGPEPGAVHDDHNTVEHAAHLDPGNANKQLILDSNSFSWKSSLVRRPRIHDIPKHPQSSQNPTIIRTGMFQGQFGHSFSIGNYLTEEDEYIAFSSPQESKKVHGEDIPVGSIYVVSVKDMLGSFDLSADVLTTNNSVYSESLIPRSNAKIEKRPQTYPLSSRFGANTVNLKVLDKDILIVSAPGKSQVSFYHKHREVIQLLWTESSVMYGERGVKLVGEQLLAGDFDGDGLEELIIGAPFADVGEIDQKGCVYTVSGKAIEEMISLVLSLEKENDIGSLPMQMNLNTIASSVINLPTLDTRLHSNGSYALFGSKLTKVNGDTLVIGSTGLGRVYGFKFNGKRYEEVFHLDTDEESFRSTFGGSLLQGTANGWLAIGDSTQSTPSAQAGSILLYKVSGNEARFFKKLDLGDSAASFDRFGHEGSFLDNDTLLVVSPYAANEKGKAWSIRLEQEPVITEIIEAGPYPYASGFGSTIKGLTLPNGKKVVFVGLPYFENLRGAVAFYRYDKL